MKILFLNIGDLNEVSGGYLFNKEVINYGRQSGLQIDYSNHIESQNYDIHIVDSLLLDDIKFFKKKYLQKTIILIHQFPNPRSSVVENDLDLESREMLRFVVTGSYTKKLLIEKWGVKEEHIQVVFPGLDKNWETKKEWSFPISSLIMVANYIPKKGYDNLIELLPLISNSNWTLDCYGNTMLNKDYYDYILGKILKTKHHEKIKMHSSVDTFTLNKRYVDSDLMLSLSQNESYGMAISESIYTGLPVLMFKTGEWKLFESSGLAKTISINNVTEYALELNKYLAGNNWNMKIDRRHSIRTWEMVGKEFFDACKILIAR